MKPQVFSSGYLIFRRHGDSAQLQFLLMKHPHRWDLPKGHLDDGETKAQAAIRELVEETGILQSDIWTDPNFEFVHQYRVRSRKNPNTHVLKELTIYLGFLLKDREINPTEHPDYFWWDWSPPHAIQTETIDPLLEQASKYLATHADWPSL